VPSNTFHAFDLHPQILANVLTLGYETPTPIQQKSIPSVMLGHDLMGLAQTGTGKTAAFLLPLLHRLEPGPRGHVRALILAPTRELAQQIHEAFNVLAKELKLRSVALYGGISIGPQKDKIRRGAEVVVACPGRLLDHVRQRSINLSKVEVLVLDEADHMFDVGFLPDIRQILQQLPAKRQSLLFSATMPKEVRQLASDILKNPVNVQISNTSPVKTITQALYPVPQNLKTDLLIKLLQTLHIDSALVFTRTKHRAKRVAEQLEKAGYTSTSLQGNLSQSKRQSALNSFRSGKLQILVATDIASRGIDIASISHVFNYDMPDTVEAYTHRIGRTGRAAKLGDAFTLLAREDSSKLRTLERTLGVKIEQRMVPDFDYKAACQSGSMHDDSPRHSTRRTFSDGQSQRPAAGRRSSGFGQGDRTGSYRGKAKSAASAHGNSDRSSGYSRSRNPSAEHSQGGRPAGRDRPQAGYAAQGERPAGRSRYQGASEGNSSERPAGRSRPQNSFAGQGDRPAGRSRSPNSFGDRTQGDRGDRPAGRGRPPSSFGDRTPGDRGDRPAGRGRPPNSFGDRAQGDRGDRPAGRGRPPNSFGDRAQGDRGDRPASRSKYQGPSDHQVSDRPAGRGRPSSSYAGQGERPPSRNRSQGPSDHHSSERPAGRGKPQGAYAGQGDRPPSRNRVQGSSDRNTTDRPAGRGKPSGAFKPGPKRSFAAKKPKRSED